MYYVWLPNDYMGVGIVGKMIEFIDKGRATTWKECADKFEEYRHRKDMESMQRETMIYAQNAAEDARRARSAANAAWLNSTFNRP